MPQYVINDSTPTAPLFSVNYGRGLNLSLRTAGGYAGVANPFPQELVIPKSEYQARIAEMEQTKSRLSDICDRAGLECLDQKTTNYCWCNSPTYCTEVIRVFQNQPLVYLSPASVGGPVTNYRNVGGWGKDALQYISDHGIAPQSAWPANAISRQYYTAANVELAKSFRVTEWWDLNYGDVVENVMSCLLRRIPVAIGLGWWSHEVSAIDPVWLDGDVALRFRNSWGMDWKDRGYAILQGSKMIPDDAVAPRVMVAA